MAVDVSSWQFIVLSLLAAGLFAGAIGTNAIALRVFNRERRRHPFSRLGIAAWLVSVTAVFAGAFAPIVAAVSLGMATTAWVRRRHVDDDPARLSPVFSLPQTPWREGGAELPAKVAAFNSVLVLLLSALITVGVYYFAE